jgi:hypothetical protein
MAKLGIKVEGDSVSREIVVRDDDGNGPKKNPVVEVKQRGWIRWKSTEPNEVFHVIFFKDETRTTVLWPFETTGTRASPPDGYDGSGRPYLEVVHHPPKLRWLAGSVVPGSRLKYDVIAITPSGVAQLDPVIIIKPPTSRLRFGLICALAGAVVGASVGALLAVRLCQ